MSQEELAKELQRSAIFLYPGIGDEISCDRVKTAQAAGCCVVTSAKGALPETVGDAGILVNDEAQESYVAAIDRLLDDDRAFQALSQKALQKSKEYDWDLIATNFIHWVERCIDLK